MIVFMTVLAGLCSSVLAATDQYYTAAVFEHARFGTWLSAAATVIEKNLDFYKTAAGVAKSKGADVIVFPEYGIIPPGSRSFLKDFLEAIPNVEDGHINPCEEREKYLNRPILLTLSCLAKNNSIVIVANMGDIQNCKGQTGCPSDGVFHFNTNVVFNRNGTLLVKYHKEYLFFEYGMDEPPKLQNSTFVTDFGTFATYICFDIIFERMSRVAQLPNIDGIMFPTMWLDMIPQLTSVQFFESWALAINVTLIAANIHKPGDSSIGSGIFHGQAGSLGYTFNPDGISKLVVTRVPKSGFPAVLPNLSITAITDKGSWEVKDDGKDVPKYCFKTLPLINEPDSIYSCFKERVENYTFTKLNGPNGHVKACNRGMCCSLNYTASNLTEDFYLGVYNGTYNVFDSYFFCEESCLLVRCFDSGSSRCTTFPIKSDSLFHSVYLSANFSTSYVYPSVVSSSMKLVPRTEWNHGLYTESTAYKGSVHFKSEVGRNLIAAGLKGRCYDRDPPHVR